MRFLMNASSIVHAQLVQGALENAGIPAVIESSTPLGTLGKVYGFTGSVGVYIVQNEDYDAAVKIALQHGHQPTHCENCGYDLTGLPEPRCPECGTPFSRPPPREPWKCPQCGEEIEGQFTECWKCGASRPGQPASAGEVTDPRLRGKCHLCLCADSQAIVGIREALNQAGIASVVCGPGLNEIWLTDANDYAPARQIAGDAAQTTRRCSRCGYDLAGLSDLCCPECGKPFGPSWICAQCGGENTEEFVKCWRCLTDRWPAEKTDSQTE